MIKIVKFLFFLSLIFSIKISAQGLNNIWQLGYSGGGGHFQFDFGSQPLTSSIVNRKMNFRAAEATISSNQGNLLFYSNGIFIADASHDTMLNGSSISIGSFSNWFVNDGIPAPQAVLIIPDPGDTNKYYMFYQTFTANVNGYWQPPALFYCIVDITQNGGLGAVIQKNLPLVLDTLIASELTACKHGNGRDWWIITHRYNSDLYYKFLLTPSGILGPFSQNIGTQMYVRGPSQSCFSPNGKKFACYHPLEDLDILDFNRCSGNFSNFIHIAINDSAAGGGVSFSPNSKALYVSSTKYVYQFSVEDTNIASSQQTIAIWDGFYSQAAPLATTFYLSQLAPDGKIYISSTNSVKHMHVINYPDSFGIACDLTQHSLVLPYFNAYTLPNHPNYFLGADSGSVCDTLQLSIKESLQNNPFNLSCYPNPVEDVLNLRHPPVKKAGIIEIIDVNGKLVLHQSIHKRSQLSRLDVSKLKNGIYLCKYYEDSNSKNIKFIKTSISE
jgi:hypothetical protein